MSKVIKHMEMDDLRRTFKDVRDLVVLHVVKLGAQGTYQLRKAMRAKNIRLKVVKNTLTRRVFREMNLAIPDDSPYWAQQTTLAWGAGSPKELSREIDAELRGAKTAALYREKVKVKGGIADGQPIPFDQMIILPTRLELIGEIISALLGPAGGIAGGLTGPVAQVASQIDKIGSGEEKKEGEGAPAA